MTLEIAIDPYLLTLISDRNRWDVLYKYVSFDCIGDLLSFGAQIIRLFFLRSIYHCMVFPKRS